MSAFVPGSVLAFASAAPPAKLSFRRPNNPLGSAAVTAVPAAIMLCRRTFHSSGVKLDLFAMSVDSFTSAHPLHINRDSVSPVPDRGLWSTRYFNTALFTSMRDTRRLGAARRDDLLNLSFQPYG